MGLYQINCQVLRNLFGFILLYLNAMKYVVIVFIKMENICRILLSVGLENDIKFFPCLRSNTSDGLNCTMSRKFRKVLMVIYLRPASKVCSLSLILFKQPSNHLLWNLQDKVKTELVTFCNFRLW